MDNKILQAITSVDFGIDTRHIKFLLITQQESHTTSCNPNIKSLKQGIKNCNSVLNRAAIFVLTQGQDMRGRAVRPHPRIYRSTPPLGISLYLTSHCYLGVGNLTSILLENVKILPYCPASPPPPAGLTLIGA